MPFSAGQTPFGLFDTDPQFVVDADKLVEFVRKKLGEPVMEVHVTTGSIYTAFEEATMEFSSIVNSMQAKSVLVNFLGSPTGSLSGSENRYPTRNLEFERRMAEPFNEEAGLNGPTPLYSASIDLRTGQQKYNLQELLSGSSPGVRVLPKEIFHFSPLSSYRFFGTTSAVNYLNDQFNFESFTPETIFYLLPIWQDVLQGMQFETSNRVRRSHYSYEIRNNELTVFPIPSQDQRLYVTYRLPPDPSALSGSNVGGSAAYHGVSNLSNLPFGNIPYSGLNSISKTWIRKMAFALAKEIEGQTRSKMTTIPIPGGDLTLNGPELINDARAEMEALRGELKELLDQLTYDKLMQREAEQAEALQQTIAKVPLRTYVGSFGPIFLIGTTYLHDIVSRMW